MNAIYTRQSLDIKDSLSIETQLAACIAENGTELYVRYDDKGFSGKDTKRPAFSALMRDVSDGRIRKVIVYRLDRLSRSILDFAEMMEVFRKHRVEFISCREKFDTSSPIGNAMLNIIMVFAQLERETIQLRMRDNYALRMEYGAYDAVAPYGYRKSEITVNGKKIHTIEPDVCTAETVKKMFFAYAYGGLSLGAIAKKLNESEIPSPRGAKWDGGKVCRIISNPIYVCASADLYSYFKERGMKIKSGPESFSGGKGLITYGEWERNRRKFSQPEKLSLSVGLHDGIIGSDVFLLCESRLRENRQLKNTGKGKHSFLTGMVKCSRCGHALKVQTRGEEKWFVCSGETNYGICSSFEGMPVRGLEKAVEKELLRAAGTKAHLSYAVNETEDEDLAQLKIKKAMCADKLNRLVRLAADGEADFPKTLLDTMRHLEAELDETEAAIFSQQQQAREKTGGFQFGDIPDIWNALSVRQKNEVAKLLIRRISVSNGHAEIEWKYDFSEAGSSPLEEEKKVKAQ